MKFSFNPAVRAVTSKDLGLACDPPLTFEIKTALPRPTATMALGWQQGGSGDVNVALEIIGRMFVSVGQAGQRYPLTGRDNVEALRLAIEESTPGAGDDFILSLANRGINNHYDFFTDESTDSPPPSMPSSAGVPAA